MFFKNKPSYNIDSSTKDTKILQVMFICGSIAIGKNGVGDYARCLAAELIRGGHKAYLLSLQERQLEVMEEGIQMEQSTQIPVLRLPAKLPLKTISRHAKNYIDRMNPSLLSLQYVPYSFHPKGLPLVWGKIFQSLGKNREWHIMFHEIWLGISYISPFKHKLIGYFQRRFARQLCTNLEGKVVTTSNPLYQYILAKANISSEILPIYSNIPKLKPQPDFEKQFLQQVQKDNWENYVVAVIFGTIHPDVDLHGCIQDLSKEARKQRRHLLVLSFGRSGEIGKEKLTTLQKSLPKQTELLVMGEQTPEAISNLFQIADIGIACTSVPYFGKSGVYAAMRLHDLEVVFSSPTALPEYEAITAQSLQLYKSKAAFEFSVAHIAQEYARLFITNKISESSVSNLN